MKKCAFIFVVCIMRYVQSESTNSEIVWLKDVTPSFGIDKRTLSDPDLPDELTFNIRRGSDDLALNLKRNHGIDPNTDIYVVRKLKDGQSLLEKSQNSETEDVAYYQDRENGAFMTVRCVERSDGQCDRIINGNIRLGSIYYDLRPVNTDFTSRNLLDAPDRLGTRYFLQYQAAIQRETGVQDKDAGNLEQELIDLFRRNIAGLPDRETTGKRDNEKDIYWVKLAILIEPGVWDLFYSLMETYTVRVDVDLVKRKIKEFYSHIINGVSLLYSNIEDSQIEINIILRDFYIFQKIEEFPHRHSYVKVRHGIHHIEVHKFLSDVAHWDVHVGSQSGVEYDHAMMFTRYDLYDTFIKQNDLRGRTLQSKICEVGSRISVIESRDFFVTVTTAAHELGHSLGAIHDGEREAISCPAEDLFIMTTHTPDFDPDMPYSRNPWLFSKCSVEAFKKTLKNKNCVKTMGAFFNETEWMHYTMKLPGEAYSLDEQCRFIYGPTSTFCQDEPADICLYVQCTHPETGECIDEYYNAARGTECAENMWCIEGRCVSKGSK